MGCVVCATRRIRCSFARRATAPPMRTGLFLWLLSCWFFILFFCLLGLLFPGRFAGLLLPRLLFAGCLPRRLARYRPRVRGLFHWRIRIRVRLHAGERIQKAVSPSSGMPLRTACIALPRRSVVLLHTTTETPRCRCSRYTNPASVSAVTMVSGL